MGREKYWTADPSELLRVGAGFRLDDVDTDATPGFVGAKLEGRAALKQSEGILAELQELLFANNRGVGDPRRVLIVLQALDTAGKGGILRHVMGAVDPQGVKLTAFGKPTPEELEHDFLWRVRKAVPEAGLIGVFDRSHYEDVLIARVRQLAPPAEIERRYGAINDFEAELAASDTTIIKVMLHLSLGEQKKRLQERLDRPDKHWKYNPADIDERLVRPKYMEAFQIAFDRTSAAHAPWYVVPADHKWYARLVVQHLLIAALEDMDLDWPKADFDVEAEKARLAAS